MLRFLLLFAVSAHAVQATPVASETLLLRYPDVHADQVVFTHGGDLWIASTQGGEARRLTAHPGLEFSAKFSPDGSQIAFTGQYGGDEQVYVMPSAGGEPRQLSFYPAIGPLPQRWGFDNQVYGWTPDGAAVVFRSTYRHWEMSEARAYRVALDGSLPEPLPMPLSGAVDLAPDGQYIVYSPLARDHRTWKRYQGGWAQDLYVFDTRAGTARNLTNHPRTDRDPMWIGNMVYFVSDRDGVLNLYRQDPNGGAATQLTQHRDWDVRWASADANGQIVYEWGGALRLYDTRDGSDRKLSIRVPTDALARRPQLVDVDPAEAENLSLSHGGERMLLSARGEVFSIPTEHGVTRNLSRTANSHERDAQFSPDGQQVLYIADGDGEERLYLRDALGREAARALTRETYGRLYSPRWSGDGRHAAFSDAEGRLHVIEIASGRVVEVAKEAFGHLTDYSWSAGGRWLAYVLSEPHRFGAIHVWDRDRQRSVRITDPMFHSWSPSFSGDGEHLWFLSNREFAPQLILGEWNYGMNRQAAAYAVSLRRQGPSPLPLRNSEAAADATAASDDKDDKKDDKSKDKTAKPKDLAIDFDGILDRVTRLPMGADNYYGLSAVEGGVLLVRGDAFYYGRQGQVPTELLYYDLDKRSDKRIATLAAPYRLQVSGDRKSLLLSTKEGLQLLPVAGGDAKTVSLPKLRVERVPAEEWALIFDQVWRRFRDYFYAPNMHGYDWQALGDKYRQLLPHVAHRSDLNYILGELIGELNASHAYAGGGDLGLPDREPVALLGARFELDRKAGLYRIVEIYRGQNQEPRYRSPLTEVGIDVAEGSYLLAIDGVALGAADNPYQRLIKPKGQMVELSVNDKPQMAGARTVLVQPLESENSLKYLAWVEGNRQHVTERSEGRLGYLHIPDMGPDGIREFIKWYYPQIRKQGLVIDVRSNGGGNVSQMIIERLSRRLLGLDYPRGYDRQLTYPEAVFHGHMATLISETSASDGDIFPYMFRKQGLGPLIGKRTWGGVIGISDWGPLVDGGSVSVPQFGNADASGEWVLEGEGVSPDIEVTNEVPALLRGEDQQLDRAIDHLLGEIERDPKRFAPRPADPIKLD